MTKLGEVFAVPTTVDYIFSMSNERKLWAVFDANEVRISAWFDTEAQALALAEAINTHDRMRELIGQVRDYLHNPYEPDNQSAMFTRVEAALAREGEKE